MSAEPAASPDRPASLLRHGAEAMKAAVRLVPDAAARVVLWDSWTEWREHAPVLVPGGWMPWNPAADPQSPAARVHMDAMSAAVKQMFRSLVSHGYCGADELRPALQAFPREMDRQEASPSPDGPPCAHCGQPCPRPGLRYCKPSHRQAAYVERRKRAQKRDEGQGPSRHS